MSDPFERAAAKSPPIIGSGCTQRYDPAALSPEQGAEFAGAALLWAQLQGDAGQVLRPATVNTDDPSLQAGSTIGRRADEDFDRSAGARR
ncbi:hypothetical protein GFL09_10820 [Pseudomonas stutzeri]|uniref:hypothetical protein n=1 Tax=Stutzerimonas stutzeri TaxID=316 RepID=UPI0009E6782E|nr:hypothetical protein [Stutzerimonas stutzeri]MBK3868178.1 hypothetical protein [Stutzerimonas stutzeri]